MADAKPRRHLAGGAALSVVAQIAPLVSGAALSIMLARKLGPAGNGHFALLATTLGLATFIASMGLPAGLTYEVGRREWAPNDARRTAYTIGILLGALAAF